jgi:hypothetical protein
MLEPAKHKADSTSVGGVAKPMKSGQPVKRGRDGNGGYAFLWTCGGMACTAVPLLKDLGFWWNGFPSQMFLVIKHRQCYDIVEYRGESGHEALHTK